MVPARTLVRSPGHRAAIPMMVSRANAASPPATARPAGVRQHRPLGLDLGGDPRKHGAQPNRARPLWADSYGWNRQLRRPPENPVTSARVLACIEPM